MEISTFQQWLKMKDRVIRVAHNHLNIKKYKLIIDDDGSISFMQSPTDQEQPQRGFLPQYNTIPYTKPNKYNLPIQNK